MYDVYDTAQVSTAKNERVVDECEEDACCEEVVGGRAWMVR